MKQKINELFGIAAQQLADISDNDLKFVIFRKAGYFLMKSSKEFQQSRRVLKSFIPKHLWGYHQDKDKIDSRFEDLIIVFKYNL